MSPGRISTPATASGWTILPFLDLQRVNGGSLKLHLEANPQLAVYLCMSDVMPEDAEDESIHAS